MASILALLCVSWFALTAAWSTRTPMYYNLEDAELLFERFIKEYDRNYADEQEKQDRLQIFKEKLKKINQLNEKSKHAVFGITKFSDLSHEETAKFLSCLKRPSDLGDDNICQYKTDADITYNDAPESFDWRDHNVVTPIKDQHNCGSCYAFSTTGNIEGQYAIKHNQLIDVSEQQILDCDKSNTGCKGGLMNVAMRTLIQQGGSESEDDYPYDAQVGTCQFDANKVKVQLTDCYSFNLTSQEKLKQLLYHNGPISIAVKGTGLKFYHNGIISDEECDISTVDHGVLLVGYGSENGVPFWIVKNSWGEICGEKGYFRMHRGEDAHSCGMMNSFMASAIVA